MYRRFVIPVAFVLVGAVIIFGVPTAYEGPLLLYINEQHSIRVADAVGLIIAVPSWLYLNLVLFREIKKHGYGNKAG